VVHTNADIPRISSDEVVLIIIWKEKESMRAMGLSAPAAGVRNALHLLERLLLDIAFFNSRRMGA
jgi:hypothetical protein